MDPAPPPDWGPKLTKDWRFCFLSPVTVCPNPPLFPPLKAPLGLVFGLMLFALSESPKAFGCLSLNGNPPEEADENGPFDKVADENPTGITEPTSGFDLGPVRPVLCGSWSGLA